MQRDFVRLEKRGYENIYNYVTSQAPLRKEEEMRRTGKMMPINSVANRQEPTDALERAIQVLQDQGQEGCDELMSMLRNARRPQSGSGPGKGPSNQQNPLDGDCFYCKIKGHRENDCEKLTADKARGIWAPAGQEPKPWVQSPKGGGKATTREAKEEDEAKVIMAVRGQPEQRPQLVR